MILTMAALVGCSRRGVCFARNGGTVDCMQLGGRQRRVEQRPAAVAGGGGGCCCLWLGVLESTLCAAGASAGHMSCPETSQEALGDGPNSHLPAALPCGCLLVSEDVYCAVQVIRAACVEFGARTRGLTREGGCLHHVPHTQSPLQPTVVIGAGSMWTGGRALQWSALLAALLLAASLQAAGGAPRARQHCLDACMRANWPMGGRPQYRRPPVGGAAAPLATDQPAACPQPMSHFWPPPSPRQAALGDVSTATYACDPATCKAPACRCASTAPPGGLPLDQVPQFILVRAGWLADWGGQGQRRLPSREGVVAPASSRAPTTCHPQPPANRRRCVALSPPAAPASLPLPPSLPLHYPLQLQLSHDNALDGLPYELMQRVLSNATQPNGCRV